MKIIFFLFPILMFGSLTAQEINQFDQNSKRDGIWRKYFEEDTTQIRYEGTFEHGNEIGLFKFYQLGEENPVATKLFSAGSDIAELKYYSQDGDVISEGKMRGETRIGEWKYYHENSDKLMMTENYEDGILSGPQLTYFPNGKLTEKAIFKNGELEGEKFIYAENGVVLKHLNYKNGELHGPAKFYNGKGELLIEGQYKHDKHDGIWKYYEKGSIKEEKNFSAKE